jgi:tetratricopeptide (TPR) repeat protein
MCMCMCMCMCVCARARIWVPMTEETLLQGVWERASDEQNHVFFLNRNLMLSSRLQPWGPEAVYYERGKLEYNRGRWQRSLNHFEEAAKHVRAAEYAAVTHGETWRLLGAEKSCKWLEKYLIQCRQRLHGEQAQAHAKLMTHNAGILIQKGEIKMAQDCLKSAHKLRASAGAEISHEIRHLASSGRLLGTTDTSTQYHLSRMTSSARAHASKEGNAHMHTYAHTHTHTHIHTRTHSHAHIHILSLSLSLSLSLCCSLSLTQIGTQQRIESHSPYVLATPPPNQTWWHGWF